MTIIFCSEYKFYYKLHYNNLKPLVLGKNELDHTNVLLF